MATDAANNDNSPRSVNYVSLIFREMFAALASLRFTVVLLSFGIFIVLVGTLAQTQDDMWEVIEKYFRAPVAWIPFQVFFPRGWAPDMQDISGGFPFPGGMSIGIAMAINLISAHYMRFKVQAKGSSLILGIVISIIGALLTFAVISGGHNAEGLQGKPPVSWGALWQIFRYSSLAMFGTGVGFAAYFFATKRGAESVIAGIIAVPIAGFCIWTFGYGNEIDEAGLRILWQLIQGGLSGVILLIGFMMIFKWRGGVVLIHAGILLLMFGEFWVDAQAVEEQMHISEGEVVNFASDTREVELAIIDTTNDETKDFHFVLPESEFDRAPEITLDDVIADGPMKLPIKVEFLHFYDNSDLVPRRNLDMVLERMGRADDDEELRTGRDIEVTAGAGEEYVALEQRKGNGADSESRVDIAAAYVKFTDTENNKDLGTYLLWQGNSLQDVAETIKLGDKSYEVFLRFKRNYKPYSLELIDFSKDDYEGTNTARNFSSDVVLNDDTTGENITVHIWMNNPLRYRGETIYQSGFPNEVTTSLQVVTNSGWMIPYVCCMMVAIGMFAHFASMLIRFVRKALAGDLIITDATAGTPNLTRQQRKRLKPELANSDANPSKHKYISWGIALTLMLLTGAYFYAKVRKAHSPDESTTSVNYVAFGRLPVMYQGRIKPLDTLARNTLKIISGYETFKMETGETKNGVPVTSKEPASRWLLDVIANHGLAAKHKVFRIANLDVQDLLGLKKRAGFRYSLEEFEEKIPDLAKQVDEARKVSEGDEGSEGQSAIQRKSLDLARSLDMYFTIQDTFGRPLDEVNRLGERVPDSAKMEYLSNAILHSRKLRKKNPPLVVPVVEDGEEKWEPFVYAHLMNVVSTNEYTKGFGDILRSHREGDADATNGAISKYRNLLRTEPPKKLDAAGLEKVKYEDGFNRLSPFFLCQIMYIVAAVLGLVGWFGLIINKSTGRAILLASTAIIVATFFMHTYGLWGRVYISGRPPVTNLYSSAVFIGWAAVGCCFVMELITRMGIGNILATVIGYSTLYIANALAADGDTFTVLVAVLDTQFWLATHVICITLGYSATFVAGGLGIMFVLGNINSSLSPEVRKVMYTLTYGVVCFALFLSFVGTVLGGLWADDSWGRFWGWDPKENGALIIVLWNALVLHARWCGMVRERGFAVLAIGGNIVTGWSWFGVNELSVGLHSYGFTEGALFRLMTWCLFNLVIMGLGFGLALAARPNTSRS
jgi:ABC-type transport system involved in cytochrome c biogenesis permease subunit